jgi:acyl dehydratase
LPIPDSAVGTTSAPVSLTVERGRLRLFAKATGQTDPVYVDLEAARAQGHRDLPVPPTFLFGVELEQAEPFGWLTSLGVDLSTVLHGAQAFDYVTPAFAGDELTATSTITDVQSKKGGAMQVVERRTAITRGDELVATLGSTIIVRTAA